MNGRAFLAVGVLVIAAVAVALATRTAHHGASTATSGCFEYAVRTDQSTYARRTAVQLLVTATNITTHASWRWLDTLSVSTGWFLLSG